MPSHQALKKSPTFTNSRDKNDECCRVVTDRADRIIIIVVWKKNSREEKQMKRNEGEYYASTKAKKKMRIVIDDSKYRMKKKEWMMTMTTKKKTNFIWWSCNKKKSERYKAVASTCVSCNFILASRSLPLPFAYRSIITTRWMKVDDRWEEEKKREKKPTK